MNQTWKIIVTVIVTAVVVGSGVYMWQKNQIVQPEQESAVTKNSAKSSSEKKPNQQFDTMDKYVTLVMDTKTGEQYKTSQPTGLIQVKNATPEGVDFFAAYIWANSSDAQTFYIETVISSPDSSEETHTWYGPFEGNLKLLVK